MNTTPIVFASDANFIEQLRTASFSAVYACRNCGPGLDIHILDCGIDNESWKLYSKDLLTFSNVNHVPIAIRRHLVDMSIFENCPAWTNGSRATWARILLPHLLPEVSCCVYSDCDVLFFSNPCEVIESVQKSDALMVGHLNPFAKNSPEEKWFLQNGMPYDCDRYLCAGLIGLNLDKLRGKQFNLEVLAFLNRYPRPITNDQTVLNWFCYGRTALLEAGWGLFPHECMAYGGELKALHFSGGYPWSRVKNAYDWVCRHCSRKETEVYNGFRTRIMKAEPFVAPRSPLKYVAAGWFMLLATRFSNHLGISLPCHSSFSALVAEFGAEGISLKNAAKELLR